MKARTLVLSGVGALVLLVAYAAVSEVFFNECGLSETQAKEVVLKELVRRGFDAKYLDRPENQNGSCSYSFYYKDEKQNLNYVVASTWLHGVKLSVWDYNQEMHERSNTSLQETRQTTARP